MRREPVGDVEDHAREEAGFRDAEQEAEHQERRRPGDQRAGRRHKPPADHDPRDPRARAEPLQREVARHFEEEIAEKENPGAEPVGLGVDADRLVHLQRSKSDVDPVDVANDIGGEQKRHQAPPDAAHGDGLDRLDGRREHDCVPGVVCSPCWHSGACAPAIRRAFRGAE